MNLLNPRSAQFFNKLAKVSSDTYYLKVCQTSEKYIEEKRLEHKQELDRVFGLIEHSAKGSGIRIFVKAEDPVWKNEFVLQELRRQNFHVHCPGSISSQGQIEWWHADSKEME